MEDTNEQEIEKRLAELPQAIREAILSNDIGGHVREIGANHKLHVDQLAILEDLTVMTMLGFVAPGDFQNELKVQLGLDDEGSKTLAADINTEIFTVVRESLKHPAPATAAAAVAPASVKISTPSSPVPPPAPAATAPKAPEMHPADLMLSQKTVTAVPLVPAKTSPATPVSVSPSAAPTTAPVAPKPPAPKPYTADPYREPTE